MFFSIKKPDEFDSWRQISWYCSKQAKKQNISLNEFVSKLPDDLFNHFKRVINYTAYTENTNPFADSPSCPKLFAETICDVFDKETSKRMKDRELKEINNAILSYGSKDGAVISVKKDYILHSGIYSRHKGCSTQDYKTEGYKVYLQNDKSSFLLGCIDTQKKYGGFMDYADVGTNKSSQDCVKKYLKNSLNISQITKPENEKEILRDILINGVENKNLINFYLAEFLVREALIAQKEKVRNNIKDEKIKEKIKGRIQKYKKDKSNKAIQTHRDMNIGR